MSQSEIDTVFIIQFGVNLREIRTRKKMSIETLAGISGIDYTTLSRIERGINIAKISTANELAKSLEIPVKDLFDFEN